MCGFVVFVGEQRPDLTGALGLLHHRGPDDAQEVCLPGRVCLGFARLAIIDEAGSRQPMQYAGRWTVVYNGELYNYRELREELRTSHGAVFTTEGDSEVFAAALHYWGPAGLDRLRGMFAYAAWDDQEKVLHAGRDPFGVKPLYYRAEAGGLWLASERKALNPDDAGEVDREALSYYLTMQYVPEPHTLDRRVRRLEAGSRLTYRPGEVPRIDRYSKPAFRPDRAARIDQVARRVRDALRESVHAHMVADVPVGAFLSSGIDSTAVVAFAREVNPDLTVFCAGFDFDGYSEIEIAEQSARHLGVRLVPTIVKPSDVIRELPRIIWHLDDPVADPAIVPLYFLARTAASHVKVVLSGEGADELFAGYKIYREPFALAPVQRLPLGIQSGLRHLSAALPEGMRGKSYLERATTPMEERYYGNARIFGDAEKARLMGAFVPHTNVTAAAYAEAAGLDPATTMQHIDLQTWLTGDILTKADRMTMAHSLELRVPFLDKHVFEVAATIPRALKLPPGSNVTKYALRQALRGVVPDFIVDRAKLGFPTPTAIWLRGELNEWAHEILSTSGVGHLIDLAYVRGLLMAHQRHEADHARKLWTVLTFCLWHAIFVERRLQPTAFENCGP